MNAASSLVIRFSKETDHWKVSHVDGGSQLKNTFVEDIRISTTAQICNWVDVAQTEINREVLHWPLYMKEYRLEKNGVNQSVKLNPRLRIEACTHGIRFGSSPRIFDRVLINRSGTRRYSKRNFTSAFFFFLFFFFFFREMT